MKRIGHVIGGRATGSFARTGPVYDPATGRQTGEVALASADEVDQAVAAAATAFRDWRESSLYQRAEILLRFREILQRRRDEIARVITSEHGKILSDAAGEIDRGLDNVAFAAGITSHLRGGFTQQVSRGIDVHETRQPLGVVAGITPFNFPFMVPMWMIPNAIACGNTFVLKPSEKPPSASLLIAEMFAEAGLPDGVLNVVQGDREAVDRILAHPDVAAVSFVGSTPVARHIYATGTAAGKRVQALGGAKNHMVVLPDCDLDAAADAVVSAAFGSAGERCMAVSVVVAVGPVADALVDKVAERIGKLRVGPGTTPGCDMGPLVTREHRDRVASYLDAASRDGAKVIVDGRQTIEPGEGFFLGPSLVDAVTPEMSVYRDEIFGPVLSVVRVGTLDEAVELINANPYGNGVAIFTNDGGTARQFEIQVDVGMVGVNVPIPVPVASYSFGGWKSSLFGDSHMYGEEGIRFYTRAKVVTSRWSAPRPGLDLKFPGAR